MTDVLLVTCEEFADGEPGAASLDAALAARGISARWVNWDDPTVDWSAAGLIAVRSPWDYVGRWQEFLAWSQAVATTTPLLNGVEVFRWNIDKLYLASLPVPTVPTWAWDGPDSEWPAYDACVVKTRVGAGGEGLVVASGPTDPVLHDLTGGPWIIQPLVDSVRTVGESSVFVLEGVSTVQVDKVPGAGEVRVHEHRGGRSTPVALDPQRVEVARAAWAAAEELLDTTLDYGRVDMLWWQGAWVVSELELIEPGLYLDVSPANADPFAALVHRRLAHT